MSPKSCWSLLITKILRKNWTHLHNSWFISSYYKHVLLTQLIVFRQTVQFVSSHFHQIWSYWFNISIVIVLSLWNRCQHVKSQNYYNKRFKMFILCTSCFWHSGLKCSFLVFRTKARFSKTTHRNGEKSAYSA